MNAVYFFWGAFVPLMCVTLAVRILKARGLFPKFTSAFDKVGRYAGLTLLALMLFGLGYVLTVAFPE